MMMPNNNSIERIEQRIAALNRQRAALDEELKQAEEELGIAKAALGTSQDSTLPFDHIFEFDLAHTAHQVRKSSSLDEKYELFHGLFSGRPDMHAHRFESVSSGKSGYVPACLNERNWSICKRGAAKSQRVKCIDCEHQAFYPISKDVFAAHITGDAHDSSDVIGSYATDIDGMCKFILVDFDEDGRKETLDLTGKKMCLQEVQDAARAFCKTCWNYSVPVYMERSRSGRGFHVWLFFSERVSARLARRMMTGMLTRTMSENSALSFSSYDMLIPRQDTISKFGFGNLVALPLQGRAGRDKERRGSLFVDEQMRPFSDQWEFLSTLRKLSASELEIKLKQLVPAEELGELVYNEDDKDAILRPWEKRAAEVKLSRADFTDTLDIIRANLLYIPKEQISAQAFNKIRRLASFRNPDFYKHQAMKLETWNKPRVLSSVEETKEYLCLPRGCEQALIDLLDAACAKYEIEDKTEQGNALHISFNGSLRDKQAMAAHAMLAHTTGVLSAPTGFGKTVLGAYIIAQKSVNTLVVVHNSQLYDQWLGALNRFLSIADEPKERFTPKGRKKKVDKIGQFGGRKKNLSGLVDVAMMQSLYDKKTGEPQDFVKDYGLVIVDECHHVPAASFEPALKHVNARCVYGLSATPFRDDGHHAIIFFECGPIRCKVDAREQAAQRPFEHYLIPRFTNVLPSSLHDEKSFSQTLNDLGKDAERNQMIVKDVSGAIKAGRKVLILTERTEHVLELQKLVDGQCENIITLTGAMSNKEKKTANNRLDALASNESFIVVATGKYIGEGFDCPMLDTLFIVMPIAFRGKVAQYTGRLHRLFEGKGDVCVYDYVDMNVPVLEKMYHKRLRGYRDVGYKVALEHIGTSGTQGVEIIFNRANYWTSLSADIERAQKEIVVVGPRLVAYQITRVLQVLAWPLMQNVVVTVVTKPYNELLDSVQQSTITCMDRLKEAGIKIVEKSRLHQRFVIIDKAVVWYGSINPLGNSMADDSLLRFTDSEVANRLLVGALGK